MTTSDTVVAHQPLSAYTHLPALVRVTDALGEGVYFNPFWLAFTGRDADHEEQGGWLHGVHADDIGTLQARLIESLAQAKPYEATYRLCHHDGSYHLVAERGAPWFDDAGDFAGLVSVANEISRGEAVMASERIAGACEQVLMLISHDLRSPLNSIQSWTHVLEARIQQAPPIVERALDGIKSGVRRQVGLIDDVQDAITVLSNRVSLRALAFPFNAAVSVALTRSRELLAERQIKLDTQLDAHPDGVYADPERTELLITKLLYLASKASVAEQAIQVRTETEQGRVRLIIRDESSGVDEALLPILLDPFAQGQNEPIRSGGLDLAVARKLVHLQGGEFEAHSTPAGMSYTVSFPLRQSA
ncbi:MAG: PAS domain-containing sensor histidine kinase [Rhodocyclaceae bacterium]